MLVQAAGSKKVKENSTFEDLYLRGLVLRNGDTFCPYFADVIKEECEAMMQQGAFGDEKEGLETTLDKICLGLEKGVAYSGKLYGTFMKGKKLIDIAQKQFED